MLTPQEKIDEIYNILSRQEKREKRKMIFAWTWRILVFIFTILIIFYPNVIFGKIFEIAYPIIKQSVAEAVAEQKNNLGNSIKNVVDSLGNTR